eukprot:5130327-Prymnesium_polylepis.1
MNGTPNRDHHVPFYPNERLSDSFRHTPIPREYETAVTGGFTARRTRIPGAACARVSQSVSCGGALSCGRGRSGRTAAAV